MLISLRNIIRTKYLTKHFEKSLKKRTNNQVKFQFRYRTEHIGANDDIKKTFRLRNNRGKTTAELVKADHRQQKSFHPRK